MTKATIYVFCPDSNGATGGIKQLYRHVDILNAHGYSARIIHQTPGFRCTWFENNTAVAYVSGMSDLRLRECDYLVVPEVYGSVIGAMAGVKKVIFNQNCYYTFHGIREDGQAIQNAYLQEEVQAAMVVSEDSQRYLKLVFPTLPVYRIHNSINPQMFSYQPRKKKQICFVPHKHPEDAVQVVNILKIRNQLKDYSFVTIHNMPEAQVAKVMQESLIYLSFGYPEGCPLPPAEAMSCGCVVIGYEGRGGREYFHKEFAYPIEILDIAGFVETVESVVRKYEQDPSCLITQGKAASDFIRATYSSERERQDILSLWDAILRGTDRRHA